ncbi:MAG TPA: cupin domain-containing protein [Syntrophales bacterium]|nr:cupin domain-containing protein [Syntrophales bacterium]
MSRKRFTGERIIGHLREADRGLGAGDFMKNLFAEIPDNLKDEWIETILETPGFRVERIVSRGHSSPAGFWYDQDQDEWVLLLKGSAGLCLEGREDVVVLNPGDCVHIDRHRGHRVEWTDATQDTVWLAIHYR